MENIVIYLHTKTKTLKREKYLFKASTENINKNCIGKLSAMKVGEIIYKFHQEIDNDIKIINT